MFIKQIESGEFKNFTYIIGCEEKKQAAVIDPAGSVPGIVETAKNEGYTITHIINTHSHYDHVDGNLELKSLTQAQAYMHKDEIEQDKADQIVFDRDVLRIGNLEVKVIHTPGHTPGGICLYAEGNLFTGDTLFVGDSGRTDLEGGHRPTLGSSLKGLMEELPGNTVVWPGHNLGATPTTTLDNEKQNNVNAKEYGFFESS